LVQRERIVGRWTREKLTLLREYLAAYVIATKRARAHGGITYVDLFAGPGMNRLKGTSERFDGSPLIAMRLAPGFSRFVFVDSDPQNWDSLQAWVSQLGKVHEAEIVYGDCNQKIAEVIRSIPTDGPCFVFLDPSSPALDWNTIASIASVRIGYYRRRPEQFILFPYDMALVRLLSLSGEQVSRVMPDSSKWRAVFAARRRIELGPQEQRRRFLYLYWMGLRDLGYRHVLPPRLISTPDGHLLYDLFFASDHEAGRKIMGDVLRKPRDMFNQQLSLKMEDPFDFQEGEAWYLELQSREAGAG
jgi:three-Cys-motif partner protein